MNKASSEAGNRSIRFFHRGDIDYIIQRHADLYAREYGLNKTFLK